MPTDQLINKAIHCLNTGQPNLAKLYIKKATAAISEQRRQTASTMFELLYGGFRQRCVLGIEPNQSLPATPVQLAGTVR